MKKILVMIFALSLACGMLFMFASCGDECVHVDADKDHKCDECGEDFTAVCKEHTDAEKDDVCDYCGIKISENCKHVDENKDAKCDKCDTAVDCKECADENGDAKCDVCGKDVICKVHTDADENYVCDLCGTKIVCKDCVDDDKNAVCDKCGSAVECATCSDTNGDGKCDACGTKLDAARGIEATLKAYQNSAPTKVETDATIDFIDEYDGYVYSMVQDRVLVTGYINGKLAAVMVTTTEKIRYVEDGDSEIIENVFTSETTTEEYYDGKRRTDGLSWREGLNFAPTAKKITLNITKDNTKRVSYTEALYNNVLTFTVANDKIGEVFGEDSDGNPKIAADSDVKVTIVNNGAVVTSITIEYDIETEEDTYPEQNVTITTEYSYDIQNVELLY